MLLYTRYIKSKQTRYIKILNLRKEVGIAIKIRKQVVSSSQLETATAM